MFDELSGVAISDRLYDRHHFAEVAGNRRRTVDSGQPRFVPMRNADVGSEREDNTRGNGRPDQTPPTGRLSSRQFPANLVEHALAQCALGAPGRQALQGAFRVGIHFICPASQGFKRSSALR